MRKFRLFPLFNEDGAIGAESSMESGVNDVPAAEVPTPGVESEVAAEPEKQSNFDKAFAKRLAEKETQWKAEKDAEIQKLQEQYKGHEDYKFVADYLQEAHGKDLLSLKEQIEMEKLQERAERENVPPEVLKRLDELETKAAKADKLEKEQEQQQKEKQEEEQRQQAYTEFRGKLDEFAKEKEADADKLYAYMVENQIGNMDAAFKAMNYDNMQQQLQQAEKAGMRKLFTAKAGIPTVPSTNKTGQVAPAAPKTFAEARARALARLTNE